jgi:serine/threonine protein kinase
MDTMRADVAATSPPRRPPVPVAAPPTIHISSASSGLNRTPADRDPSTFIPVTILTSDVMITPLSTPLGPLSTPLRSAAAASHSSNPSEGMTPFTAALDASYGDLLRLTEAEVRAMGREALVETALQLLAYARESHQHHTQFIPADAMNSLRSAQDLRAMLRSTHELKKEVDELGSKMLNQYVVLEELGKGSQGKVKLAFDTERNVAVAIKIVRKPSGSAFTYAHQESVRKEIAVMKKLRHRHIVALLEVIDDPESAKMYIVMQHIDNGVIAKVQRDLTCQAVPAKKLLKYTRQITASLEYLHRHHVSHRDIKPENILVNLNNECFLADFGVSEITGSDNKKKVHGRCGTLLFMSPELLRESEADGLKVDMWALGVTLWVLLTGKMPFQSQEQILDDSFTPSLDSDDGDHRHERDHDALWHHLLPRLMDRNPATRMSAKEAHRYTKAHEFDDDLHRESNLGKSTVIGERDVQNAVTSVVRATDHSALNLSDSALSLDVSPDVRRQNMVSEAATQAIPSYRHGSAHPTPPRPGSSSVHVRNPFLRTSLLHGSGPHVTAHNTPLDPGLATASGSTHSNDSSDACDDSRGSLFSDGGTMPRRPSSEHNHDHHRHSAMPSEHDHVSHPHSTQSPGREAPTASL